MNQNKYSRIGVLTSGGDAQGMNAAVRSVIRTAITLGVKVYAIYEGYEGLVSGGKYIKEMSRDSVGGIIHKGGTFIGSARCDEFFERSGRLSAARNLLSHEIDRLVIIGGDGSLTGANIFRQEWAELTQELVLHNLVPQKIAERHPHLYITGLVGSIDNDMYGTDITIGADSALHRITEAVDAIMSTAASHQRTFVVKVMGRNCGYLALMGALATGADWVIIPENPPDANTWKQQMAEVLIAGRKAGKRDTIVILSEGAHDRQGNSISSSDVSEVLEKAMGEEVRETVLGHVQRGGSASAFDRNLGTLLGNDAVNTLMNIKPDDEPKLIGLRGNRITHSPLEECVKENQNIVKALAEHNYEKVMDLRGSSFREALQTFNTMLRALPHPPQKGQKRYKLAVMHAGAPAPGMNTAVRAAVRIGLDKGHTILGIRNGFPGLANQEIIELNWMSVNGWASMGGAELGTNRKIPSGSDIYNIARTLEEQQIQGVLIIGGWTAYESVFKLFNSRENYPAFNIPFICLPASISNNLPGSELSIGADTALNNIVEAIDKIKDSAVAQSRVFVVEVMGRYCGYLALMSGLATGAERVYMHEEGVTLNDLLKDVEILNARFTSGKRLGLMIRNEYANAIYSTSFICSLFEEEGKDLFDVRQSILGHMQEGGKPSPFDRIQATRLATRCINYLIQQLDSGSSQAAFIGLQGKEIEFHNFEDFDHLVDFKFQRPKEQWWLELRPILTTLTQFN